MHLAVVVLLEADVAARGLNQETLIDAIWAHASPSDGLEHSTAVQSEGVYSIVGYLMAPSGMAATRRLRAIVSRVMAQSPDPPSTALEAALEKDIMTYRSLSIRSAEDPPMAHPTPYLVLDMDVAADCYRRLSAAFHDARVYYAVKANPEPRLIRSLAALGASFDVASPAEIDLCLAAGAGPEKLSYGNTIKKAADIAYAFDLGVRMFAFDSQGELEKLAKHAAESEVYCRIAASSAGAQWPLSRKFGCAAEMAAELLIDADQRGLQPLGVSFHVGSQQLDPWRWDASIAQAAMIFRELRRHNITLTMLNAGGGFPVQYREPVAPIADYANAIAASIDRHFGDDRPQLAIEPGRYIAAPAGVLRTQVVLISRKSAHDPARWVYLDVGRFGGLAETEGEAIQYRITTPHDARPGESGPVMIAGPTCDSVDVMYQKAPYSLPLALQPGDLIDIHATGAYTATYCSVGFNGFPPLPTTCIGEES